MPKIFLLLILGVFVLFFGLFVLGQTPVTITSDEISMALAESIDEVAGGMIVNEAKVEMLVKKSVAKLEQRQIKRLKYLVSAYFVIWLIFVVYTFRLVRVQAELLKRVELIEESRQN
ncbi:TPA: CcmD family protein [Candidatus Poribacteria bacterium]|nr:CcmD family protein [Candidatus Poribacteria bacterium]HIA65751.1 CcmD family protein [Candidatus Poribacteria bacterium]HIB88508.1 CcmD family protein [Candidatus Poribacteria bacterium]HIC02116.1 CcmD family protein [Candidatus Poribacteria bacterium]HIN31424.1 CcmD family protein [Candidatus Poribacteria bacterium]